MLRIILPQLSVLFSNIKSSNRILYTYTNIVAKHTSDDHEIKIKGFIRLDKEVKLQDTTEGSVEKENIVIEGIGEIKETTNKQSIIYFGNWRNTSLFLQFPK